MQPQYMRFTVLHNGEPTIVLLYPVFYYRNSNCELHYLLIYADGTIICDGQTIDISGLRSLMQNGVMRTTIPESEGVFIPELVYLVACNVVPIIQEEECLKEIEDIFCELSGRETTSERCRRIYHEYLKNPTEESRIKLQEAYDKVPIHLYGFLLGFVEKDMPIRRIIYGEDRS